ncbi:MAG: hypothetical protein CL609_01765 [Anaerolineaceae bacterium]|nr:hypothetical protein [Anaerolineaceae bacterium]
MRIPRRIYYSINLEEKMAKNKRSAGVSILIIIFLFSLCSLLLGSIWAYDQVSTVVFNRFGDPTSELSFPQKIKLSLELYIKGDSLFYEPKISTDEVFFQVENGQSIYDISEQLRAAGYIQSVDSFINYLIYRGYDRRIQSGKFVITDGMNGIDIARKLINPIPEKIYFVVLPGWRAEEIADALVYSGLSFTPDDFLRVVRYPTQSMLPEGFPELTSLEGYLAPGEYYLDREITISEFIRALTQRFAENINGDLKTAIAEKGLTFSDAVILASIVERESIIEEEMPIIASVFLNRYEIGMKLDSDPTAQYAVGYNEKQDTWWTNPLSLDDLNFDSVFNTYIYSGLPPHPICNPSLQAIQAVAYAADTPYFYFRAKCDSSGKHEFARSYEEHLLNGCE